PEPGALEMKPGRNWARIHESDREVAAGLLKRVDECRARVSRRRRPSGDVGRQYVQPAIQPGLRLAASDLLALLGKRPRSDYKGHDSKMPGTGGEESAEVGAEREATHRTDLGRPAIRGLERGAVRMDLLDARNDRKAVRDSVVRALVVARLVECRLDLARDLTERHTLGTAECRKRDRRLDRGLRRRPEHRVGIRRTILPGHRILRGWRRRSRHRILSFIRPRKSQLVVIASLSLGPALRHGTFSQGRIRIRAIGMLENGIR